MIDPIHSLAFSIHSNPGVYGLLLGSGISRSAGIPTGWDITLDLITKLAAARSQEVNDDPEKWFTEEYKKAPDYSDLLDELSGTQTERQQLLRPYFEPNEQEREQGFKQPTAAHKAIASLVAKGFFKVIITTNFDRLMEKALEEAGVVPDVLSSVDQVHGAKPLIHMNCCIFKIHGDYMDTRIRNTPSELDEYPEEYETFLERIFDEFGLIVCGWSADWDAALCRALFSSPSRRYTTFWAARGEPGDNAKKLIQHRDGQRISITDADSFFQGIGEGVESISKLSRPHPLSAEIAVATVKRYLSEPKYRIDLSDLISESVDRVMKETSKGAFETQSGPQPDVTTVTDRLHSYEAITSTLQSIAVTGGRWAEDDHFAMWERAIQQLTVMPVRRGYDILWELRAYPGKLLLYSLGLGAVDSGRLEFLNRLFKTKVRIENSEEITAAAFLANFLLYHEATRVARSLRRDEGTSCAIQ